MTPQAGKLECMGRSGTQPNAAGDTEHDLCRKHEPTAPCCPLNATFAQCTTWHCSVPGLIGGSGRRAGAWQAHTAPVKVQPWQVRWAAALHCEPWAVRPPRNTTTLNVTICISSRPPHLLRMHVGVLAGAAVLFEAASQRLERPLVCCRRRLLELGSHEAVEHPKIASQAAANRRHLCSGKVGWTLERIRIERAQQSDQPGCCPLRLLKIAAGQALTHWTLLPNPSPATTPHLLLPPRLHQDLVDGKVEQQRVLVAPRQLVHQLAALCGNVAGTSYSGQVK